MMAPLSLMTRYALRGGTAFFNAQRGLCDGTAFFDDPT
jgi:hypothetical protein